MGSIRTTNTVSGTLDGVTHSITGAASIEVNGCTAETLTIAGTYVNVQAPSVGNVTRVLVANDGATEVKVRVLRVAATTWDYFNIPAGRHMVVFDNGTEVWESQLDQLSVKTALGGAGRVIVLQAWR